MNLPRDAETRDLASSPARIFRIVSKPRVSSRPPRGSWNLDTFARGRAALTVTSWRGLRCWKLSSDAASGEHEFSPAPHSRSAQRDVGTAGGDAPARRGQGVVRLTHPLPVGEPAARSRCIARTRALGPLRAPAGRLHRVPLAPVRRTLGARAKGQWLLPARVPQHVRMPLLDYGADGAVSDHASLHQPHPVAHNTILPELGRHLNAVCLRHSLRRRHVRRQPLPIHDSSAIQLEGPPTVDLGAGDDGRHRISQGAWARV